mmetsp:Transcript_12532/g.24357  ORF Transcript_12532/g.24357 Transcript_12532/m.24357 type:complete len:146 (+) Transcript_12532:2-439(+)
MHTYPCKQRCRYTHRYVHTVETSCPGTSVSSAPMHFFHSFVFLLTHTHTHTHRERERERERGRGAGEGVREAERRRVDVEKKGRETGKGGRGRKRVVGRRGGDINVYGRIREPPSLFLTPHRSHSVAVPIRAPGYFRESERENKT